MSFLLATFLSFYICVLVCFPFVSHPIVYCILLLSGSVSGCAVCYWIMGFSWYVMLYALIYIGGVYVLFIFVSVMDPNTPSWCGWSLKWLVCTFIFFFSFFYSTDFGTFCLVEYSHGLCSPIELCSFSFYSSMVAISFCLVSMVVSDKGSFYR